MPKPFRLQSLWLRRCDFLQVVQTSWEQPIQGFGMARFSAKLRCLKEALWVWNHSCFGSVFHNVKTAEDRVKHLEEIYVCTGLDSDLIASNEAQAHLLLHLAEEEDF